MIREYREFVYRPVWLGCPPKKLAKCTQIESAMQYGLGAMLRVNLLFSRAFEIDRILVLIRSVVAVFE